MPRDAGTIRVIDVLILVKDEDGSIEAIELSDIEELGELQALEAQLAELISTVLAQHADAVAQYRTGKTAAFGFLVGQVMKAASGKANPKRVNELLRRALML